MSKTILCYGNGNLMTNGFPNHPTPIAEFALERSKKYKNGVQIIFDAISVQLAQPARP